MAVTYALMKSTARQLYEWSLRKVPDDTQAALRVARARETNPTAQATLDSMLESAREAERTNSFLCSDAGVPVYFVKIGTAVRFEGDIKQAIADGFDELVRTIEPPILKFITNPLTGERSYKGKDMPLVSWDMISGADYVDVTCQPKALGSGRWAALKIFSYPTLDEIEQYVLEVVITAGSQPCPPVVIGVGIGGTFDHAAHLAKEQTLRQIGSANPEPILADMERRLIAAINETGFGPMGTGGATTGLAVHIDYAAEIGRAHV